MKTDKKTEYPERSPKQWANNWKRNICDIERMAFGARQTYQTQVKCHIKALKKLADKIAKMF